jgi:IS5 family transposase
MRPERSEEELFDEIYRAQMWVVSDKNPLMRELATVDRLLDQTPEILAEVAKNLTNSSRLATARPGKKPNGRPEEASAEQVLRCAILMQLRRWHYRDLTAEIEPSALYRKFTRFYLRRIPHFATLNALILQIQPETWKRLNEALLKVGIKKDVEDGKRVRHDTTVSQTSIAYPLDSRLLWNCVRVLCRHLHRLRAAAPELAFAFHDRTRAVKKLAYKIVMLKGRDIEMRRRPLYKALLDYQEETRRYADGALKALEEKPEITFRDGVFVEMLELEHYLPLADRVHDQARRRVMEGEKLAADEKLVSIFEPHTDIIKRGKASDKTEFGHKFAVATGRSGMITFYEVFKGNPGDNEVLPRGLEEHVRLFGKAPEKVTADRRYHSAENEAKATAMGVKQVALPKAGWLSDIRRELQHAPWFRRLLKWRAGVEGNLSTLLRRFGLTRCLWHGWNAFQSYIGLGVFTYNIRLLAGHLARC